jgi:16S rRNA (guanine527-N7)-methyltransferase
MPTESDNLRSDRLSQALREHAAEFRVELSENDIERLCNYYSLVTKWNSRLHLVAPCPPEEFATRHILESLLLLRHLPRNARIADVGSGAGLPIIPCLIMREDLSAVLFESSQNKGVFLREVLRELADGSQASLMVKRFEETPVPDVEFVTCRAIERFRQVLPKLIEWTPPAATLLLLAGQALKEKVESLLPSVQAELVPRSERRFLLIARR